MTEVEIVLTAGQEAILQSAYHAILIVGGCLILLLSIIVYNSTFKGRNV